MQSHPIELGRGTIIGRVVANGKAVQIADIAADPEFTFTQPVRLGNLRTMLGVPLLREGTPIGVIVLSRKTVRPFTDKQIDVGTELRRSGRHRHRERAAVRGRAAAHRELSESLEQQTATSEVLKVISSSPGELEPVFQAMLENATRICEAEFGHFFLSEGDDFRVVALQSAALTYPGWLKRGSKLMPLDNPHGPLAQLARTKKIVHIADLAAEQAYIERNARMVALVEF